MEDLLFICHRLPYPPNKGDKIRSYNILKYLSARYRVHLATFVDDPSDEQYVDRVKALCESTCIQRINPRLRRLFAVVGLITNKPLSNRFYKSKKIQAWIEHKIKQDGVTKAFHVSSPMAQYTIGDDYVDIQRVMDFVDVDSEKWFQYAKRHAFPMNYLYLREGITLRQYEERVARIFDKSIFVSAEEANFFGTRLNYEQAELEVAVRDKILNVTNGVDTHFFDPIIFFSPVYPNKRKVIVFTGTMDYWANTDAVLWFAKYCFPSIRVQHPDAHFYIVGRNPTPEVNALGLQKGIEVTGTVEDIRPYLLQANVIVAPLRVARGIQNKVLEAFAMNKPVIATPPALAGLVVDHCVADASATGTDQMIQKVVGILAQSLKDEKACQLKNRVFVTRHYSWTKRLEALDNVFN